MTEQEAMKPTGPDDFPSRDPDPITARDWILVALGLVMAVIALSIYSPA